MIELENIVFAPEKTQAFLQAVLAEGANKRLNRRTRFAARNRNILGSYFASIATEKALGRIYGKSRQRISQIIHQEMSFLYKNCSPSVREQIPFEEIPLEKELRGSASLAVLGHSQNGLSPKDISNQLGISGAKLGRSQIILRKNGYNVPHINTVPAEREALAAALQEPRDDISMQELLNQVKRSFYRANVGNNGIIASVRDVLSECGFHYQVSNTDLFIQAIKDAGIPLGTIEYSTKERTSVKYHFVVRQHRERVREALLKNPALGKFLTNPVEQISGPKDPIPPSSYKLVRGGFESSRLLLWQLGLYPEDFSGLSVRDLLMGGCPVAVYQWQTGYYYRREKEDVLRAFLEKRLAELGLH